ncbi:hypothetical protein BY996DRAFT_6468347 [Phakopsora pachyrhizi]|nr:hypothetical protein BY996DRAFT_6468347 [Phakopsora pachyrhizi]
MRNHGGKGAEPQHKKEAESLNGSGIGIRLHIRATGYGVKGRTFKTEFEQLNEENRTKTKEECNSLVEDDQLIEGLVLLWSMTDSQRIGYHYLSNLKFVITIKQGVDATEGKSLGLNNNDKVNNSSTQHQKETMRRAKESPRSLRATEDINKQEKPIIQIDKQELGQRQDS